MQCVSDQASRKSLMQRGVVMAKSEEGRGPENLGRRMGEWK
jgi:hypothetical protein